jgi:DNA-binding CsgD family transcriptional regulator
MSADTAIAVRNERIHLNRKADVAGLTGAEIATLDAMARLGSIAAAARELGVAAKTIENRIDLARDKLDAPSRRAAIEAWRRRR